MRKLILLILVLTLATVGVVKALEPEKGWKIVNPCFNDAGKWYTREVAQ